MLKDFAELLAGEIQQQDQRHHAAALAPEGQSRPCPSDYRIHRRRLDHRSGAASANWNSWLMIPVFSSASAPPSGATKRRWPSYIAPRTWHHRFARLHVRCASQTAARIQAPTDAHALHHRSIRPPEEQSVRWICVPRTFIFERQSRARLCHGQADYQAHPPGRGSRQRRSAGRRQDEGGVPAQLPRVAGGENHSRRRSERTDFARRHRGIGYRQHEAATQRGADHRNSRRRQRGNHGRSGRRKHLHLRHEGSGSRATPPRLTIPGISTTATTKSAGPSISSNTIFSACWSLASSSL